MGKNRKRTATDITNLPRQLRQGIEEANNLLEQNKPRQALELLNELELKYPQQPDVIGLKANAYTDIGDHHGSLLYIHKLHEIIPKDPNIILGLASEYLANEFPTLALKTFRQFIEHPRSDERAGDVQKIIVELERNLPKIFAISGISYKDEFDFVCRHEELRLQMELGNYERCRRLGKSLLAQHPDFTPVLNNLSLVEWMEGYLPGAIELGKKVLEFEPDNIHALSNLSRFNFMLGRVDESNYYAQLLKQSQAEGTERWVKKAEALCFIGDDEGILALIAQTKNTKAKNELNGIFWHWCAVAEYRLGNISKARKYWHKSVQDESSYSYAQANLDELQKPLHQRVCPQSFSMDFWVSRKTMESIVSVFSRSGKLENNLALQEKMNRLIDSHLELIHFVKQALLSGDIECREFALHLAEISTHQKILADLKDFALSNHGPDKNRIKASQILTQHNIWKSGEKINLWLEGEWKSLFMFGMQISSEPSLNFTSKPGVKQLMEKAIYALQDENGEEAEMILRKAIKIQGDEPSLLNNLAVALQIQGKNEEAHKIAEDIPLRFPDYFFGQVIQVHKALGAKDLELARNILDRMMQKSELHITEFSALCSCQIEFLIADKQPEGAISWYEIWKQGYPDDPALENYKNIMKTIDMFAKFKQGYSSRKRKRISRENY